MWIPKYNFYNAYTVIPFVRPWDLSASDVGREFCKIMFSDRVLMSERALEADFSEKLANNCSLNVARAAAQYMAYYTNQWFSHYELNNELVMFAAGGDCHRCRTRLMSEISSCVE